jgi:hypothetical protein
VFGGGEPVLLQHHRHLRRHEGGQVHAAALLLQALEVLVERAPVHGEFVAIEEVLLHGERPAHDPPSSVTLVVALVSLKPRHEQVVSDPSNDNRGPQAGVMVRWR